MQETDLVLATIPIAAAGLVAFGVVKGKLYNYITHEQHRDICSKERTETNRVHDKLFKAQEETRDMVKEIHGYLKAKNGGVL